MSEPPKLTLDEQIRRLKVMLNAKLITQADFDKRVAALQAQTPPPAPPRAGHTRPTPAARGDRRPPRFGRPREDHSELFIAPYRFITVPNEIVEPDEDAKGSVSAVKPNGFCAEIAVTWEAETPLLIGAEGEKDVVIPMTLGGSTDYIIPGATLRGLIRAATEIVAFGRLTQVNASHTFGLRDFDHGAYGEGSYPVGKVTEVRAGWLRRTSETEDGVAVYSLAPCADWWVIEADALVVSDLVETRDSGKEFTRLTLREKYGAAGYAKPAGKKQFVLEFAPKTFRVTEEINGKPAVVPSSNGAVTGVLVFSGKSPSGKRLEYVLPPPPAGGGWIELKEPIARRFERMHGSMVKDEFRPDGSLEELQLTLQKGLPVPVFFVGDPKTQELASFALGLTRLFKVPHERTVGEVVGVGARLPKLTDTGLEVDLVEDLFGYVYETTQFADSRTRKEGDHPPSELARKGRVAFSFAKLTDTTGAEPAAPIETVMMGPRASFAPFYLRGKIKDYSDFVGDYRRPQALSAAVPWQSARRCRRRGRTTPASADRCAAPKRRQGQQQGDDAIVFPPPEARQDVAVRELHPTVQCHRG